MLKTRDINMFLKFTTSLFIALTLCSFSQGQNINWLTDFEAAKRKAARENKLILLHFTADWCGGCRQIEQFVFSNISVSGAIESQVVPVKIDVDLHPDLVAQYNVKGIPFDVTTDPNGAVVMQRRSPASRDDYLSMVSQIAQMNPSQAAGADPVQRQLLEHMAANDKSSAPTGLDFRANQIDFRPSRTTIDPTLDPASPAGGFQPDTFRTASISHSNDFDATGPQAPEMQQPALSTDNQFAGTPGFTANPLATQQPAPTQAPAEPMLNDLDIPQQSTEIVRPRVKSQRIINEMFVERKTAQEQMADPVAPFDGAGQIDQAPEPTPPTPDFALSGNCPVTLLTDSQWVKGDKDWGCVHRGRVYIFASEAKLKTFLAAPDDYSPILAGFDPVDFCDRGELNEGQESLGVFMSKSGQQKVVLFHSAENRAKFQEEPKKYMEAVRTATQRLDQRVAR